jgi:hypothetical protein
MISAHQITIAQVIAKKAVLSICARMNLASSPSNSMAEATRTILTKYEEESRVLIASIPSKDKDAVLRKIEFHIISTWDDEITSKAIKLAQSWFLAKIQ